MTKQYTLIIDGSHFSLSNETDYNPQSDYFPGIWAIKTQKKAIKYSQELLAQGDEITVKAYSPRNYALANKFINILGLKQELFNEPSTLRPITSVPMNGKPSTLAAFKKFLVPGYKVKTINYFSDGPKERETHVVHVQSNAMTFDVNGRKSWLEFGKASEWTFDNEGATKYYISDKGNQVPSTRIEYLNQ